MSITFDVANFIVEKRPCEFCTPCRYRTEGEGVSHYCDGMNDVCLTPSVNLANVNARALLEMLDIEFDHGGMIKITEYPRIQQKLMRFINQLSARAPYVLDAYQNGRVIDCGRSDARLLRQLTAFRELITYAQEKGEHITWG